MDLVASKADVAFPDFLMVLMGQFGKGCGITLGTPNRYPWKGEVSSQLISTKLQALYSSQPAFILFQFELRVGEAGPDFALLISK